MSPDHVTQLIIEYRYWILIPLSFIEGPIVAFVAGTLASLGYFNLYALAVFFFVRDITADGLCYALGHWGAQTRLSKYILRKMHITDVHMDEVRKLWNKYPGKTMFLSKLSYGVAAGFIIVAGMVRMPVKEFFKYAALIAVAHYISLLLLGYFFGVAFGSTITGLLEKIPYVLAALSVFALGYYFFKRSMTRKLEEAEEAEA